MSKSRALLLILLCLLLIASGLAQQPAAQPPEASQPGQPAAQSAADAKAKKKRKEPRISPKEAEELFRSVDEILKFVSDDTGLPIKEPVKRALATREQVEAYVAQHMKEDKDTQRMEHSEVVLEKFGLLPRGFDLQKFLVDLMGEQVAGYYDPKTKTVYLLDWLPFDKQRAVMAHELTHALQDQNFGLEQWLNAPEDAKKNSNEDVDDEATARVAVTEGQAMLAMIDYETVRVTGRPPTAAMMQQFEHLDSSRGDYPLLKSAPLLLQESLSFPYGYGLGFEYDLLLHGGKKQAYTDVFNHPPRTTRDIMEPEAYLHDDEIPAVRLPDLQSALGTGYRKYDDGSVGEFDVFIMVKQYAGEGEAQKLSSKWSGGAYLAVLRTNAATEAPAANPKTDAGARLVTDPDEIALVYLSRWARPQDANRFANDYARGLPQRYHSAALATDPAHPGARVWKTEQGPVVIDVDGDRVLISEGLDDATAARIHAAILAQPEPELKLSH